MEMNIDNEFWSDFIQEAFEHIEEIETNVITLEQHPDDMDIIHTMFRAFHTIKGLSGFVEHVVIQEISHNTETLMDLCRKQEKKVTKDIVDAILKSADYIRRLCEDLDSYKDDSFIDAINTHIKVLEALSVKDSEQTNVQEEPIAEQQEPEQSETSSPDEPIQIENTQELHQEQPIEEIQIPENNNQEITAENQEEIQIEEPKVVDENNNNENLENISDSQEDTQNSDESPQEEVHEGNYVDENGDIIYQEKSLEEFAHMDLSAIELPEPEEGSEETKEHEQIIQEHIKQEAEKKEAVAVATSPVKTEQATSTKKTITSNEEFMKVANNKIDNLVNIIGELIINQSLLDERISKNYADDNQLMSSMSSFLGITRELQYLSMSLRMVSLKSTFHKVSRIARDTIKELNKDVEFVTSGENTEIDRVVTEKLLDPLVHLIKNAISHGIEVNPDDRQIFEKPKKARVELNAYNKRGKIFIEVKDDGRGIDIDAVYQKAIEKGIASPTQSYTDEEIIEFIMLPGFSTAKVVDNISGRGVGMDVVRNQILKIGGKIDIKSKMHEGSTFTLEVPVNHAIMNGTVIEMNGHQFIVPTINVKEIIQPNEKDWIFTQQNRTMLKVRENIVPIIPLTLLFPEEKEDTQKKLVLLLELDQELRALPITNVVNRQEVVVKPVGEEFADLRYIAGMSILGNGRVSLILDTDYLFKKGGTD